MKKASLLFAANSLNLSLLSLSGCGNSPNVATIADADVNEAVTLRFAYTNDNQPVTDAISGSGRLVKEKTDGSVQIQYFPGGQPGGKCELIELTQSEVVDFIKMSVSVLESFSKDYSIFPAPYPFNDEEHFFKVMDNEEMAEPIYRLAKNLGSIGLTYYDSDQCSLYMVDGPTHTPKDLKGKKIRVMQSETVIKVVELLGGSPVPMGSDGVYTSFQSSLVNRPENSEFVLYTAGHGGAAKYYPYDEYTHIPDTIIMNDVIKEQLTAEQEKTTEEVAKESTIFGTEAFARATEEKKVLAQKKHGVQLNDVDNTLFREVVVPLHDTLENDPAYKDLYRKIRGQGV